MSVPPSARGTSTSSRPQGITTSASPSRRRSKGRRPLLPTATMENGNTSRIIVWSDDTVIVKKPLTEQTYYFVADVRTGQPVPLANVELFGGRHGGRWQKRAPSRYQDAGAPG